MSATSINWRAATAIAGLLLAACSPAPDCRIDSVHIEQVYANAGCMIRQDERLLVVRHHNGRLGFPAGTSVAGETAQCTAHRETWEETGLAVEVGQLLHVFDNGFRLYHCRLSEPYPDHGEELSPPWQAWREIDAVLWMPAAEIKADQWRYPQQWPQVEQLFEQLP